MAHTGSSWGQREVEVGEGEVGEVVVVVVVEVESALFAKYDDSYKDIFHSSC